KHSIADYKGDTKKSVLVPLPQVADKAAFLGQECKHLPPKEIVALILTIQMMDSLRITLV
ncbi:hypothetical protein QTN94_04455, partial [Vibrio sp. M250220]